MQYDYDVAIIGGGSAGIRFSRLSNSLNAKVILFEKNNLGGTCVNIGCIPKKHMHYAADLNYILKSQNEGFKISSSFNWEEFLEAKNEDLTRLHNVYNNLLNGVTIIQNEAKIINQNTIQAGNQTYTAKYIVIATGLEHLMPNIPGIELATSSDDLFFQKTLPKSIVIVGGGYIAVEIASILNYLEVEVHLIHRSDFLKNFEKDCISKIIDDMQSNGVNIHFQTEVHSIEKISNKIKINTNEKSQLEADQILFAVGRKINKNFSKLPFLYNQKGFLEVDQNFQTNINNIFALGDLTGFNTLTPFALATGNYLANFLFGQKPENFNYKTIPTAVFSLPQFATVGLTENEARKNHKIKVFTSSFKPMKYSLRNIDKKTYIKMIVDKSTDMVLGCHMVGDNAAEIIQIVAVAMQNKVTKYQFDQTLGIHPSSAEEFVTLRNFYE